MSTEVPLDEVNFMKTLNKACKCGHKLSEHGFVDGWNYSTGKAVVSVFTCALCDCDTFEEIDLSE